MLAPKGVTSLATVALLGVALLAGAPSASSARKAPAFSKYVACGLTQKAKPSHRCTKAQPKGAFFRSNVGDVFYGVCVRFPSKRLLCAPRQKAIGGTLYVNRITTNIAGLHVVTWYVKGKRVGRSWFFVPERTSHRPSERRAG